MGVYISMGEAFYGNSKIIEKYVFDCNIKPIIENMEKW